MARSQGAEAAPVSDTSPAPLAQPPSFGQHIGPFEYTPEAFEEFAPVEGDRGDDIEALQPTESVETPEPATPTEPEPQAKAEPEPEPEHQAPMIPKARFDEVNTRRKALAEENERLKAELAVRTQAPEPSAPPAPAYDFTSKEKEYMEAVLDGDTDKALAIRGEIRQAEFQQITLQVQQSVPRPDEVVALSQQQVAQQSALEEVNAAYPVFDPTADNFDADLTEEAVAIAKGFIEFRGMDFPSAIRKAADQVARLNGIAASTAASAAPKAPTPKDVASKIERATQQPPTAPVSQVPEEPTTDVMNLTEEEFEKLPAATKARLRGDFM
jgi:hypothetical protein